MSSEQLDALRGASATLLTDALRRLGHDPRTFAMSGIRPMVKTRGTTIGPAVTTKYEVSRERGGSDDIRRYVFKTVDDANPGDVWVTASGTDQVLSMMGDIIILACKQKGLAGIVIDGGCRDTEEMNEIGLPVYAKGTCLYGPGGVVRPVAANVPVVCGGVEVRPGDIVAASVDGALVIPVEVLPDVVRLVPELEAKEAHAREIILQGAPLVTSYPLGG
ncbi:MAG TPA: hypothetical protein DEP84_04755 [Chloroflexi bacterium]|nr:hypothetical protein [Chloroflexota bacterium]